MKKKSILLLALSSLVLLGFASVFFQFPFSPKFMNEPKMLNLSPGNDYAKDWVRVDSMQNAGLPESARTLVNAIFQKAQKEKNDAQLMKALLHLLKYNDFLEENAIVSNLQRLHSIADSVSFPLSSVIHTVIAENYSNYYSNNSWEIQNRTQTSGTEAEDIRTWDASKLIAAAQKHYLLSVENADSLRRVNLDYFDAIIEKQDKSRKYRPSLYDLLAWRAFDFFRNDENSVTQPVNKFQIEGDDFFKTDEEFAKVKFESPDSSSKLLAATRLLQALTQQHLYDEDPSARVFVARERLQFGRKKAISDKKEALYLEALEKILAATKRHEVSTYVSYDIALWHNAKGASFNGAVSEDFKDEKAKALAALQVAIDNFNDADGTTLCKRLFLEIHAKQMDLQMEKVNISGKPFLGSLSYTNIHEVYFRTILHDKKLKEALQKANYDQRLGILRAQPILKAWKQELPKDDDYNRHSVQIMLPEMESGEYMILMSNSEGFESNELAFATTEFLVSKLGFSHRTLDNGQLEFVVFDRETGEALEGVEIESFENYYDYDKREYVSKKGNTYRTDKAGFFILVASGNNYSNFHLTFRYKGEVLNTGDQFGVSNYKKSVPTMRKQTFLFTDRGIYRPGQTVYFKGVCIETDGIQSKIQANVSREITFFDANNQKVHSEKLQTNEFGSYAGSFTAPQGQLTGQMHISDNHGTAYFSVEDYKRPKFEVSFEPIKGSFKLGQKVKVEGKAVAYAGSNIDGAEVKYRIVRTASFPWWGFWCWGRIMPSVAEMEIASGIGTTDTEGKFEVEFEAIPDRSISSDMKPQFSYRVYADVVDITGETHSSSTVANVGYLALNASVQIGNDVDKEGPSKFKVSTTNLNGQKEEAAGTIKIHRLDVPKTVFKSRGWPQPDKFVMTEAEFRQKFPFDLYKNENEIKNWKQLEEVYRADFNTAKNDSIEIANLAKWPAGQYILELSSKDKFGAEIKSANYFTVSGKNDEEIPTNEAVWFKAVKLNCEPGEIATFRIGTALKSVNVLYEVEEREGIVKREWIKLSKGIREIQIPVAEKHRGGFGFHLLSASNGRVKDVNNNINVPWSNKALVMEYATFRDKLQPGAKEEWTVKIKGPDGDKVAAELLAGMYDASLDEFRSVYWGMSVNPYFYANRSWRSYHAFNGVSSRMLHDSWNKSSIYYQQYFDHFNWFGYSPGADGRRYRRTAYSYDDDYMLMEESEGDMMDSPVEATTATITGNAASAMPPAPPAKVADRKEAPGGKEQEYLANEIEFEEKPNDKGGKDADLGDVKVRTNLNETAFFFPQLSTDDEGNVVFKFTMPEALTRWRFMTFAHTKDLKVGYKEGSVVTQKEVMVMPNAPRFFRENDEIVYMAKVSNLSDKDLSGQASLELFDALTMQPVDVQLGNSQKLQSFSVKKGQSAALSWKLKIPAGIQAVTHRVKAVAGEFSDGEESALPVLTNSMLVTESMPLPVRPLQTKTFEFKRMADNKSTTLRNHKLTLEFTSNPAWYAVQSLPYLMEYPYECTEQVFSRYYANSLASNIANKHPRIKQIFDQWKTAGKEALLSNLEKNQELKYLLLEETPWVMNAQDESERKKRVGLLFDLNKMADELARAQKKLIKAQVSNGGFTWFPGMPESRYITQHVVTGFGHLDHLGVKSVREDKEVWQMLNKAVAYLDIRLKEDYDNLLKYESDLKKQHISQLQVQYLYARSYFKDIPVNSNCQKAFDYYKGQAGEFWLQFNKYNQGMIALGLKRFGDEKIPLSIIRSLKEFSQKSEELGMYWKANGTGLYWYEAPIETQALLIEAFDEVANDQESVEEMKLWLLKQKQTQDWKTTKATAEACYALLLRGSDYLAESKLADITIGGQKLDPSNDPNLKVEAGTGYFKTSWMGEAIKPDMANVTVKNNNKVAAWGAVYWQYFEQLDKITFAENKLQINKQLFLEENSPTGPKLSPVKAGQVLHPGDKVKVRILIEVDRDMEYVHMKDMRAAGFEPINVISRYKYQDGLGYYETTRDAATNFFFDWLPKGKYVFEYPLRVTHQGDFSNGITTIQCMYAPEFTSHSEGIRVKVAGK